MTIEATTKSDLKSNCVVSTVIEQDEDDSRELAPLAIEEITEGIEVFTIEEAASSPENSKAEKDQKQKLFTRENSRFKHFSFKREHQKENQPAGEKALREPSNRLSLLRNHKNKPKEASNDAQLKILITKRRHYQAKRSLQLKNEHDVEKELPDEYQFKKEITAETQPQLN